MQAINYCIFSFRSRTECLSFYELLLNHGVDARIVSTPRRFSGGCGLSVKIPANAQSYAFGLMKTARLSSFLGSYCL